MTTSIMLHPYIIYLHVRLFYNAHLTRLLNAIAQSQPLLTIITTHRYYHNPLLTGLGFDDFLESLESALSLLLKPIRVFVPFDKVKMMQCSIMLYHLFCFHPFAALMLLH